LECVEHPKPLFIFVAIFIISRYNEFII